MKAGEASAATAAATAVTAAAAAPSQSEQPEESGVGGGDCDGLAADTMEAAKQLFERARERGLIHQCLTFKSHLPFSKWQGRIF